MAGNEWTNAHNREQRRAKAIKYARIIMEPDNNPVSEVDYLIAKYFLEANYENEQLKHELEQCQRRYSELAQTIQQHIINSGKEVK
jgi:hypothetical protein